MLLLEPGGRAALVDAGPGIDISPALRRYGVDSLSLVIATHPHADHIGGMRTVLEAFPVRFYMDNGEPYTTSTYLGVMRAIQDRPAISYLTAGPRTLEFGSATIAVLPIPPSFSSNPNNQSVAIAVTFGAFTAFLSGDSERPELEYLLASRAVPGISLMKAPHHGSDDAVSLAFLEAARPRLVTVSVGRGNVYGHPSPGAIDAYERTGAVVLRTDEVGEILVEGYADGRFVIASPLPETRSSVGEVREARPVQSAAPTVPNEPSVASEGVDLFVFADAPGNDHENRNGEYVVLTNRTGALLDLSGWRLCDAVQHCFGFPVGALIPPGADVVVYTGDGEDDSTSFFWRSPTAVWNNRGDTATLYDATGQAVATYVY